MKYGEVDVKSFVPGAEIIAIESEEKEVKKEANGSAGEDEEDDEFEDEEEEIEDDEEDSDEEGWVDVSQSEDEAEKNEANGDDKPKLDEKDKVQKALEISTQRILTQEDFKRINREQIRKKVEDTNSASKRKNVEISESEDEDAKKFVFKNLFYDIYLIF